MPISTHLWRAKYETPSTCFDNGGQYLWIIAARQAALLLTGDSRSIANLPALSALTQSPELFFSLEVHYCCFSEADTFSRWLIASIQAGVPHLRRASFCTSTLLLFCSNSRQRPRRRVCFRINLQINRSASVSAEIYCRELPTPLSDDVHESNLCSRCI